MINSWLSEADRSRKCCCGVAGGRACPAPGWGPKGSWQMASTQGCASSSTENDLVLLPGRNPKEGGRPRVRTGGAAKQRTPLGLAEEGLRGSQYADRCLCSLGLMKQICIRITELFMFTKSASFCSPSLTMLHPSMRRLVPNVRCRLLQLHVLDCFYLPG